MGDPAVSGIDLSSICMVLKLKAQNDYSKQGIRKPCFSVSIALRSRFLKGTI
jgi:hypothetical protein